MLQQTQVRTVIPYWHRFLAAFPTVRSLAEAPEETVLSLWQGLGYYSRARQLHRGAQQMVSRYSGQVPGDVEALATLPSFGRYTVGAVASIAFGLPAPLVDGNVARVLTRLFAVDGMPGDALREKELWRLAERLVPGERPGDWNQALMELGAVICKKEAPLCLLCPVQSHCAARLEGRIEELPPARVRAARKPLHLTCAVVIRRGKLLLAKRHGKGLFGGLWELPCVELGPLSLRVAVSSALSESLGVKLSARRALGWVERTLTHRDLRLTLWSASVEKNITPVVPYEAFTWVTRLETQGLGISTAMRKAVELALGGEQNVKNH